MEVVSFFSSSERILLLFDQFIYQYDKLKLNSKDEDTAYFTKRDNDRNVIYYHYLLNDVESEFSYNYSENEINAIKLFFGEKKFYLFDLSYKEEFFLTELMKDFRKFLGKRNEEGDTILISHPHLGIIKLYDFG